jgi:transcriptional regulator with XRE-family HTH domain
MLMSYGERFRFVREQRHLTQEQVAKALKYKRAAPVSLIERKNTRVPRPRTIQKHARALGCEVWELLAGVPTDYDRLRTPQPLSDAELAAILWGLAYLPPPDREKCVDLFQAFLDSPALITATPLRAPTRAPATVATATRTHRGTRRA